MARNAVAFADAIDAPDHDGPADPPRIDRAACDGILFDGAGYARSVTVLAGVTYPHRSEHPH